MANGQNYDIYFFDHSATRVFLLQGFKYLEFHQRVSSPWNSVMRIESAAEDPVLINFFRNILERDFITEVWRTDEVTGDRDLVYEGFHRTLIDQVKNSGIVVFTLYGVGYSQLLKRRIILPITGQEYNSKSGVAETVMRDFVSDSAISPVDADRIISGLSNDIDVAVGSTAEYSARYTNLFTVISRLAEQGGVDFGVTKDTTVGTFLFEVRELWGTDKTHGNSDGNVPVVFDVTLGNMLIPILSKNGGDEVNFVYIGGQQQGVSRIIETRQDAAAVAASPWNRHENFVDARSEDDTDGLQTRGQAVLDEQGYKEVLTFNVQQTAGTRWIRDWVLGDLITARYAGQQFHKKIVEVTTQVSAGESGEAQIEGISVEMEDV